MTAPAVETLSEEERYLAALLMDTSGIDLAEWVWQAHENEDNCFRARPYQWAWWRCEDPLQIDQCARSVGKSLSIKVRMFAFPFVHPGQEAVITAPELVHLEPIAQLIEAQFEATRLGREMMRKGATHRPFMMEFTNGARIIGRIPQRDGKGVKGIHPLWLEQDEASDYGKPGWTELTETLKRGQEGAVWRGHGVTRGMRDNFYKNSQHGQDDPPLRYVSHKADGKWTVHRIVAMARPDWTDEERREKEMQYGSRDDPDYRRNVLGAHGDSQSPIFVLHRLMRCVDDDPSSEYNTDDYWHFQIKDTELDRMQADIVDLLDFPSTHSKYKSVYIGMDVGYTTDPSEILVLAETHLTSAERSAAQKSGKAVPEAGTARLQLIARLTLRRISEPAQADVMTALIDFYKPQVFAMDSTGNGLPLFQQVQRRMEDYADRMKSERARRAAQSIQGFNFSSKILVDFDETIELDEGLTLDERVREAGIERNVLEYCVDDETQVLTRRGWMSRSSLLPSDQIATLNTTLHEAEWQPLLALHEFDGEREMELIESRSFSSFTTLSHRWWVRRPSSWPKSGTLHTEWRTTDNLVFGTQVPRPVPFREYPQPTMSDDLIEVLAWMYTEGCFHWGRAAWSGASLSQSQTVNAGYCARIRRCLTAVFGTSGPASEGHLWREHTRFMGSKEITHFYLTTAAARTLHPYFANIKEKILDTAFLFELSEEQMDLFIDVSIMADGSIHDGRRQFAQSVPERTDVFALACTLRGFPTSVTSDKRGRYVCSLLERQWTNVVGTPSPLRRRERRVYNGVVWCPETRNGTWLARRKGSVYFTGNSTDVARSYVDEGRLWLPWDIELIDEMRGQTFSYAKATIDRYGRRRVFSSGTYHALDALRMAVLGHRQKTITALLAQKEPETAPVMDVFVSY